MTPHDPSRPLRAYRVVELPGPEPLLFGKTFADLGAHVIKVEPPGGDPARLLPPFAVVEGERQSLYWQAYSAGKRSVIADLETEPGRALVRRLAASADVLVEALPAGRLTTLGLGFEQLREENAGLVMTSITAFGQDGPFSGWQGSDLVHLAMSGYLNMTGPADGPPIKPSAPYQTFLHGSMQAVAATLLALRRRRRTGHGGHVDQAMRDTGMWMLTHTYQFWDLLGVNLKRQGSSRDMGGVLRLPSVWKVLDGYIVWLFQTGHIGGQRMRLLVAWMAESDMAPDWMQTLAWETFDLLTAGLEANQRLTATFAAFFATKTKAELFDWSMTRGIMLAPVQTLQDVANDVQLASRDAWRTLQTGSGPGDIRVPGPPVRMSAAGWEPRGPIPRPGEHNRAVFGELLGIGDVEIAALGATGIVEEGT